jgi:hypothetical protein
MTVLRRQLYQRRQIDVSIHNLACSMFKVTTEVKFRIGVREYFGAVSEVVGEPGSTRVRVVNLATGKERDLALIESSGLYRRHSMLASDIQKRIMGFIYARSGFEPRRQYVGMSHIADCPRRLAEDMRKGQAADDERHRMAFLGYSIEQIERDILMSTGIMRAAGREIVAEFDERVRGHVDGETVDGDLIEIKSVSVLRFEKVLAEGRALRAHFEQVQAYMHFGGYRHAEIVYVCRDDFRHKVIHAAYNMGVGERLEAKARALLAALDANVKPKCECGRCQA